MTVTGGFVAEGLAVAESADADNGVVGTVAAESSARAPLGMILAGPGKSLPAQVEIQLTRMVMLIRLGTATFLYLPLARWDHLSNPWLALTVVLLGTGEGIAFAIVSRRRGVSMPLVVVDIATCILVMTLGSRAVPAEQRNVVMTELIPFALGSAAILGISRTPLRIAAALITLPMLSWLAVLIPVLPLKTLSDELGFALWLLIGRLVSSSWRRLAAAVQRAERDAQSARQDLAEQQQHAVQEQRRRREAHYREELHRQVHDLLLPVVDHVGGGQPVSPQIVRWARDTARLVRIRLENEVGSTPDSLLAELTEVIASAQARGVSVEASLATRREPPAPVRQALVAAVAEALTNVVRHAATDFAVVAVLDLGTDGVQASVRDRGRGFDQSSIEAGGGLGRSFDAVRRHGGTITIRSGPSLGTLVVAGWEPAADGGEPAHDDGGPVADGPRPVRDG